MSAAPRQKLPPLAAGLAVCRACGHVVAEKTLVEHTFVAVVITADCDCRRHEPENAERYKSQPECDAPLTTERRTVKMRVCPACVKASGARPLVLARHEALEEGDTR